MVVIAERAVTRTVKASFSGLGADIVQLRGDAGITRAELARAARVDPSYLARIELGVARPSFETLARIAIALGADLATRLYPTTGPLVRDRHQSAIAECLVSMAHPSWARYVEIAVRRPSRGWIDLGLHHSARRTFVATEIQSQIRRLEQLIRWSEAKAASLASWEGWARLGPEPSVSRLLVVRATRATRSVASEFRRVLRASYPADPDDALASLLHGDAWPGPAMLWAVPSPGARDSYRLVARP